MSLATEIPEGPMAAKECFAFIDQRPREKWELIDAIPELLKCETPPGPVRPGGPTARVGATLRHARLSQNIAAALLVRAGGSGCEVLRDFFVRAINADGSESFMDPDVIIRCGAMPNDLERSIDDPSVVFEVLSPSTLARDRGLRFDRYRTLASLHQIILVYPGEYRVETFSPGEGGNWLQAPRLLTQLGESLEVAAIGTELAMEEIYQGVAPGEG
ncbi:MAG: hypothetical protein GVY06_05345 [Alphaproteobacteria bacterium]|nr:hypothetical protein [Alphaproteobacteria bacterium]